MPFHLNRCEHLSQHNEGRVLTTRMPQRRCHVFQNYIRSGDLVPILESNARAVPGFSLYYPSRTQSLPKLRAFADSATKRLLQAIPLDAFLALPASGWTDGHHEDQSGSSGA